MEIGSIHREIVIEAAPEVVFDVVSSPDHLAHEGAAEGNSLLVTFELTPRGTGTLLAMTESGFRELGWEAAVLEAQYADHVRGWDHFLPRLAPYVATLQVRP